MKAADIKIGGHYTAKVNGKLTTVRVDEITEPYPNSRTRNQPTFRVTNLSTSRKTIFRSAAKFKEETKPPELVEVPDETYDGKPVYRTVEAASPLTRILRNSIANQQENYGPQPPHLIVEARAGTGKTTTLVEGLKLLKGLPTSIEPSPQQRAVWDQILLSKDVETICFVAFNKSIATELQRRVPPGCDAMTMHSLGFRAVQKVLGRQEPNSFVVQDIIAELMEVDLRELRRTKPVVLKATEELVSLCKMNLVRFNGHGPSEEAEKLFPLASYYDIDLNGNTQEVFNLVPHVLERCKEPRGRINFDDMIWLPVVLNLPVPKYDLLLVDEAQDLNRCQQALAKKAGKRLILVGDPKQAIYGFAGADSESMKRMETELSDGKPLEKAGAGHLVSPKCVVLPLTVTRRCGKAIVAEAQRFVPGFKAHETNPEGKISYAQMESSRRANRQLSCLQDQNTNSENTNQEDRNICLPEPTPIPPQQEGYADQVLDGDMVLCRVNAPLVSECFKFLKAGRRANIQGRDIGAGLVSTIRKLIKPLEDAPVLDLIARLSDWSATEVAKENTKRNPSEARITSIQDRADCLACFTEGVDKASQVIAKIESIFTDAKDSPGIKLSSIHKAKGLEAKRVFILQPKGVGPRMDKMQSWELEQERNLQYVAITRAIEELTYVS